MCWLERLKDSAGGAAHGCVMSVQACVHTGRCSSMLPCVYLFIYAVAFLLCVCVNERERERELHCLQRSASIISTDSIGRMMRENKRENKTKMKEELIKKNHKSRNCS